MGSAQQDIIVRLVRHLQRRIYVQQEGSVLRELEIPYQQIPQAYAQQAPLHPPAHQYARPVTTVIHHYPAVYAYPVLLIAIQSILADKVPLGQVLQQTLPP